MMATGKVARFILALGVLCCYYSLAEAQPGQELASRYGGYLNGSLNLHSANFQTLPGVPSCCPRFETGNGFGTSLGVFYDWIFQFSLSFELRFGYSSLNATLTKDEVTTVTLNDVSVSGIFEHTVRSKTGLLAITPLAKYEIFKSWNFLGGITAGLVLSNTYSQQEEIIQPESNGTFENGKRIRNQYSGATPNASKLYAGFTLGIQYQLPLNSSNTLQLLPELQFTYGITPIAAATSWKAHSIKAGVSIQYDRYKVIEPPPPDTIPVSTHPAIVTPVEIKPKAPKLSAELASAMIDTDAVQKPITELVIEDYIRTQYRPLLNYIFFDKGSAELSARYHKFTAEQSASFSIAQLNEYETLPLYYELLNIIGKRMMAYPKARLTITGCNDDIGVEKNNRELSKARAEAIYAYLKDTWKLPPSRLRIELRNLPEKPSTVTDSDGAQENRRVEISSNAWQIMEPIFTTDTAHVPKPSIVRFIPKATVEAAITHWQVSSSEPLRKLKEFSGKDSLPQRLDWELEKERERTLAKLDTVTASFTVSDNVGQTAESPPILLPVRHYTLADKHREGSIDTIISRYSLILFDFDRSELSEANRRIADFVKERISEEAKISIYGYTDRIGTDDYNRQLSEDRARSTQKYIGLDRAEVKGLGRRYLLYENSLPEGRFYSRTVTVIVSTPTKH
jgi:outer membrane protein OmpA-like peptidoglycan-associated protein